MLSGHEIDTASIDCYGSGAEIHAVQCQQGALGAITISRDLLN